MRRHLLVIGTAVLLAGSAIGVAGQDDDAPVEASAASVVSPGPLGMSLADWNLEHLRHAPDDQDCASGDRGEVFYLPRQPLTQSDCRIGADQHILLAIGAISCSSDDSLVGRWREAKGDKRTRRALEREILEGRAEALTCLFSLHPEIPRRVGPAGFAVDGVVDPFLVRSPVATALATIIAATPAAAQTPDGLSNGAAAIPGLVTESVEPGVELVLGDAAFHDLRVEKAEHFKSIDQMEVGPDGTVWLRASISDSDGDQSPGLTVFALGQDGTYTVGDGIPEAAGLSTDDAHVWLHIAPDGTPLLIGDGPGQLFAFDGEAWAQLLGSRRIASDDRVLYLIEPSDIPQAVSDETASAEPQGPVTGSADADLGIIALEWSDGDGWVIVPGSDDVWAEMPNGDEAGADDGGKGILWFNVGIDSTTFLEGVQIWDVRPAPDGSLWVLAEGESLRGELFSDLYRIANPYP